MRAALTGAPPRAIAGARRGRSPSRGSRPGRPAPAAPARCSTRDTGPGAAQRRLPARLRPRRRRRSRRRSSPFRPGRRGSPRRAAEADSEELPVLVAPAEREHELARRLEARLLQGVPDARLDRLRHPRRRLLAAREQSAEPGAGKEPRRLPDGEALRRHGVVEQKPVSDSSARIARKPPPRLAEGVKASLPAIRARQPRPARPASSEGDPDSRNGLSQDRFLRLTGVEEDLPVTGAGLPPEHVLSGDLRGRQLALPHREHARIAVEYEGEVGTW